MERPTIVVVPARDEEARIGACLRSLARQTVGVDAFTTIVVLDACRDRTGEVVAQVADGLGLEVTAVPGPGTGSDAARRVGMDLACERLLAAGRPEGLIAGADAGFRPAEDWLERQLRHVAAGARAIAGLVELGDEQAGHGHFGDGSLGLTATIYRQVGGVASPPDARGGGLTRRLAGPPSTDAGGGGLTQRLAGHRVPVLRAPDVRVRACARGSGSAARGLSVELAISSWAAGRRHRAVDFPLARLAEIKGGARVTVIVPTKECAATIGEVLRRAVSPLARRGLVDELVVVDADSRDGTAEIARDAGARVIQQDRVVPELGPALGKGDAMWRALQVTGGDVVCFLDGDTADPSPHHLQGLLGPLLHDASVALVKGAFDRPLDTGSAKLAHEGGRVTELMARPLLNLHEPLLSGFAQPLAGEFAARRDLLEETPFPVGYGVEIAVLIDALRARGLDALAECHLGSRQNRHQPLRALGEMAYAVLAAVERRLPGRADEASVPAGRYLRTWEEGRVVMVPVGERPPIRTAAPIQANVAVDA